MKLKGYQRKYLRSIAHNLKPTVFVGKNDITTNSITDHVEHYLDLVGSDHVGIGLDYFHPLDEVPNFRETVSQNSDYWPPSEYPTTHLRCAEPRQIHEIAENLLQRNHHETVVSCILGGNFRRVATEVWK